MRFAVKELAPTGRQNIDGGKRSVAPGHTYHPPPFPSLAPLARGRGCFNNPYKRGFHPRLYSVAPSGLEGGFAANGRKEQEVHMRCAINATNKRPTVGVHYSSRRRICSHVKRVAKAARPFIACATRVAITENTAPSSLPSNLIYPQSRAHYG